MYHNGQTIKLDKAEIHRHETLCIDYWECKAVDAAEQQIFRVVDPDSMKNFNNFLQKIIKKAKQAKYPKNKELWKAYYSARDMFADMQYSYASTIHKLQGSTYETVYIDLFSFLNNEHMSEDDKDRLVYVAITRASKSVKLFVSFDRNENAQSDAFDNLNTIKRLDQEDMFLKQVLS
ncbi:MAG: ATP-binding domain-containing protein [Sulfurovum sp.]|nr:ATP-binding domain-containing protein [Sulfurovum sp.]